MTCPICGSERVSHGSDFRLCVHCGVEFADPFKAPDAAWYESCEFQNHAHPKPGTREPRHDLFFELVPKGSRVLEYGCGNGQFLLRCREEGYRARGFDIDLEAIECAKDLGLDAWNIAGYKFPESERWDAIVAIEFLEHLDEPMAFLKRFHDMLKPGGFLYLTVPNRRRPLFWYRERMDRAPHHLTRWDVFALRGAARAEGLMLWAYRNNFLPANHFYNVLFPFLRKAEIIHWLGWESKWAWRLLTPLDCLARCLLMPFCWLLRRFYGDAEGRGVFIAALFRKAR